MRPRQTLPALWLLSDARNDAMLEEAMRRLPRGSGVVFRHYHLPGPDRRARFARLARLCRQREHWLVLAGTAEEARRSRALASYGPPSAGPRLRLATAHSLREIGRANRTGAALVLLSPVFPTRSHPGAPHLGPLRFLLLARRALCPVVALGGMDHRRARQLPGYGWAAIDGLSHKSRGYRRDS